MTALTDPRDPIRKAVGEDRAQDAIIARDRAWLASQPKDVQRLYCEHGAYVGVNGALAYMACPLCPDSNPTMYLETV